MDKGAETNNHTESLGPYPSSFSFGFTQDERDAVGNDGTHVEDEQEDIKKNDRGSIRIKSKICKVVAMVAQAKMDEVLYKKKEQRMSMTDFGGILKISKWISIRTNFVRWVIDNWKTDTGPQIRLSPNKVLKVMQNDVQRVYHLPRGDKRVDISQCADGAIERLREELGIGGNFSRTDMTKYNWCQHVLEHTTKGITVNNKLNPTSDFHFLLINYLERMGTQRRLLTGQFTTPSLSGWDESSTVASLLTMEEMVGLSKAVVVGVIKERRSEDVRVLMPFDPETCPMEKVPKFVAYCKAQAIP
ncbi:hypothetical protein LIER_30705 [Lithospermum erythrorhizon]|uniref:Uncharacterized protein n=1 Tax=Lithospermum erythrorhizon TaxID=34254 RepID=A0AAV3RTV4_LITER